MHSREVFTLTWFSDSLFCSTELLNPNELTRVRRCPEFTKVGKKLPEFGTRSFGIPSHNRIAHFPNPIHCNFASSLLTRMTFIPHDKHTQLLGWESDSTMLGL